MRRIFFIGGLFALLAFAFLVNAVSIQIHFQGWETGSGGWSDPGADSNRQAEGDGVGSNPPPSKCSDSVCDDSGGFIWHIQDDSTTSNTEQNFNFTGYDFVNLSFWSWEFNWNPNEYVRVLCDSTEIWRQTDGDFAESQWLFWTVQIFPANCTFDSSVNIRFDGAPGLSGNNDEWYFDGINFTGIILDETIAPNVTGLIPLEGSSFNFSDVIEISANVTDNVNVSYVFASISLPNGSMQSIILNNSIGAKYNSSYTISNSIGRYNVRIIANDTNNNINDSETTYFDVDGNFSFVNEKGYGYLEGILEGVYFYNGSLQLESGMRGNFTSQVFDAGVDVSWKNISWQGVSGSDSYRKILSPTYAEDSFGGDITSVVNLSDGTATWERVEIQSWNDSVSSGTIDSVTGACEIEFIDAGAQIGFQVSRNNGSSWDSEVCVQSVSEFTTFFCDLKTNSGVDTINEINNLRMRCTFPTAAQNDYYSTDFVFVEVNYSISSEMNFSARSCDDFSCLGESWDDINDSSFENLSLTDNQYFQYRVEFESSGESPRLSNVSISYIITAGDGIAPSIAILEPGNLSYNEVRTELNYTVNDDIDLDSCWYSLDEGETNTSVVCGQNISGLNSGEGSSTWKVWANDSAGNVNSSAITFFVDSSNPGIDSLTENPSDGVIYSSGQKYEFNATINEVNLASVLIEFGGVNYSVSGNGGVYNFSIFDLAAGSYEYYWFANDSLGNENITVVQTYIVNQADGEVITYINGSRSDLNAEAGSGLWLNGSLANGQFGNLNLTLNGIELNYSENSGLSYYYVFNSLGTFVINTFYSGNSNYTSDSETWTVNVSDTKPPYFTTIPSNIVVSYGEGFGVDFDATDDFEFDSFSINWSNTFSINQSGYLENVTELGIGVYLINVGVNDTSGNLNSTIYSVSVNKADGNVSLLINGLEENQTAVFGASTNASADTLFGNLILYRDGVDVTNENGLEIFLGVGDYNYTATSSGDQNHSSALITKWTHITQAQSEVNLTLNYSEGNKTIFQGTAVLLNGTLVAGDAGGELKLFLDGSLINSGTGEVSNLTLFNETGLFNVTVGYLGSQNYSSSIKTYFVNVIVVPDTTNPDLQITYPLNQSYGFTIRELNYSVSDENLQSCWYSIDGGETNTSIVCSQNITGLTSSEGNNLWEVWANDSSGNVNQSRVMFFVDSVVPLIEFGSGTENNGSAFSRDWIYVNVSVIEANEENITFTLMNLSGIVNQSVFYDERREINWTNLTDGVYYYNVSVNDILGNGNWTRTRTITLDSSVPTLIIHSPEETVYGNTSILLNISSNGNIWFEYNGVNESYNGEVYRNFAEGANTLVAYANNSAGTLVSESVSFFVNTLVLSCEAGGPYQQNALVLVQGTLRDENGFLEGETINMSILRNNEVNYSAVETTASDGSFQAEISNLGVGSYVLSANASVNGINQSCADIFFLGGNARFVLDKIATVLNVSNNEIVYNVTLILTNNGLADALLVNISDDDGGLFFIGELNASESTEISYPLVLSRENITTYYQSGIASAFGVDSFSFNVTNANSSALNLTVPSLSIGRHIVIAKNVLFVNEESLNVTYNVSSFLFNSGDENLESISYIDTDISGLAVLLNLSRGEQKGFSNLIVIDKAASNTVHQFALGTATINAETFYSNRPSISISGYGGPADLIVDAPVSVTSGGNLNAVILVKNVNEDIGQDFTVKYWITSELETVNYTSGEQTVYVSANGETNLSVNLLAPNTAGSYRLRALVTWIGGQANSFDSFEVVGEGESSDSSDEGTGGDDGAGGGGFAQDEEKKIIEKETIIERETVIEKDRCEKPYIQSGEGCCMDENGNSICDESEAKEPEELGKGITGLFIYSGDDGIRVTLFGKILLFLLLWLISYFVVRGFKSMRRRVDGKSLKTVRGIKVFTISGMEIGRVKEIILGENKIESVQIKLLKKFRHKGVSLKYKHVQNVKDIMIVDERVLEKD